MMDYLPRERENADFFLERVNSMEFGFINGKLVHSRSVESISLRVRVLNGGIRAYITSDPKKFDRAYEFALESPPFGETLPFSEERGEYLLKQMVDLDEKEIKYFSTDDKLKVRIHARVFERETIYSSDSSFVHQLIPRIGLRVAVTYKGVNTNSLAFSCGSVGGDFFDEFFRKFDEIKRTVIELDSAGKVERGNRTVVLDEELVGVLVHEAVGHALEADAVYTGLTVLNKGDRIGRKNVNIVDDPGVKEFGHFAYDDEGFRGKRRVLVENGVVREYISDSLFSRRTNSDCGSGRNDFGYYPIPRMSNTYLLPGDVGEDELLELMGNGYVLTGFAGGTVVPSTGVFQFASQYGFVVKNGQIEGLVRGTSLSGNLKTFFMGVTHISREVNFKSGTCGKGGQYVSISDGGPKILARVVLGG